MEGQESKGEVRGLCHANKPELSPLVMGNERSSEMEKSPKHNLSHGREMVTVSTHTESRNKNTQRY